MSYRKYVPLCNKYRPAILKMMMAAAHETQQYKFTSHEFKALDERKKSGFDFSLMVSGGKAQNNIKNSEAAQDLLNMLQLSRKGAELIGDFSYEISLDKQFILHIRQVESNQ